MKHDPHCTCPDCILDHAAQLGDPIAQVAREFEHAERAAAPLADVPFTLTNETTAARGFQKGLFNG